MDTTDNHQHRRHHLCGSRGSNGDSLQEDKLDKRYPQLVVK